MPPSVKRRLTPDGLEGSEAFEPSDGAQITSRKKARRDADQQPSDLGVQDEQDEGFESEEEEEDEDLEIEHDPISGSHESGSMASLALHARTPEIPESATISRVEVVNFMCHKFLKVDFGPKINFVIGHNGSGKSAILTAITIALGAKANSTNRGKKLSSLIREGANAAQVIVHLTNDGPDAFRPDVYGKTIQIERKLLRDGSGSYKIKSASGKTVSTRREELTTICDHMSIQVDNPLTILSQDNARQFLNSSTSQDKYKLFMRGTQLEQLAEDYSVVRESIDTTRAIIERKKQYLPDLQKKAKEAQLRYQEMLQTRELDSKIDELNNELVWSQIITKEKELESSRGDLKKAEDQVNTVKEKLAGSKRKVERFNEEIQEIRAQKEVFRQELQPGHADKQRLLNEKMVANGKLNSVDKDIRDVNEHVKQAKRLIQKYEGEIEAETAKLESTNRSKRDGVAAKIGSLESEKEAQSDRQRSNRQKLDSADSQDRANRQRKEDLTQQLSNLRKQYEDMKQKLRNLNAQKDNKLKAYGQFMPDVINDIAAETRWKRKPVGPLGRHLTLKYPEYANVLETVLNRQLQAFVVESFQDKTLLARILSRRNMSRVPIIVAKYDLFDYSRGEPDSHFLTIVRALEFDDEWVKRQMIIAGSIEQILLMDNRAEADRIMYERPRNVKACYTKHGHNVGASKGMRTDTLRKYNGQPRLKNDVEPEIRDTEQTISNMSATARELREKMEEIDSEIRLGLQTIKDLKETDRQINFQLRRITDEIERLKESLKEDEPVNISVLEEEKKTWEKKVRVHVGQFQALKTSREEMVRELQSIVGKLTSIEAEDGEREQKLRSFNDDEQKMEGLKQMELQNVNALESKMAQRITRKETIANIVNQLENTLQNWTQQAMEDYPDRVETTKTSTALQREIDHCEVMRTEKEKAVGRTLEQVEEETNEAVKAWNTAKVTISHMEALVKNMKKALDQRIIRWEAFRMHISLSAKVHFAYYMHKRGDNGTLKFNHKKEKLEIRVSTGDQFRKGGTRQKDSKSLSGGEKSFSQISLLLSMWQGIASPILCLDEFDVYMDAVNRKQSMKMMLDSAKENSSQYILITPQDASNMTPGPLVTVHRLADPERHQD